MSSDLGHGMHSRSTGSSTGTLQEIERAYRESLLGGDRRVSDTRASITYIIKIVVKIVVVVGKILLFSHNIICLARKPHLYHYIDGY